MNLKPSEFKNEIIRKVIHISSASIPIGYYFLQKEIVLYIIIPITIFLVTFELLKYKVNFLYSLYLKVFKGMLREHEYDRTNFRFNGASWVLIGDAICIIVFPKYIAISGMLLLSLSDSISAFAGQMFAKKYYAPNRSYIGSITFFIVGVIVIFLSPKYFYQPLEYLIGIIAVLVTTVADAFSIPADDNLFIPVVSCTILYVLYVIFFPAIFAIKLF